MPGASCARGRPRAPWCTLAPPSAGSARPGDVVHLASAGEGRGSTHGVLHRRGSSIVYQADGPVTIVGAARGTVSVMFTGVHDIVLRDLTIRARRAGGWIDNAAHMTLAW